MSKYTETVIKGGKDGLVQTTSKIADELTGNKIYVKVTHCGLCHTDLHYMKEDMVLGHGATPSTQLGPFRKLD